MLAWLAEEVEEMRRTRESVASASSAGRVISSSTWAGSAFEYGMLISSPGNSTSGRNASGSLGAASAPSTTTLSSTMPAVTGLRRLQRERFMGGGSGCASAAAAPVGAPPATGSDSRPAVQGRVHHRDHHQR